MVDQVTNIDLPLGLLNNIGAGIQNKITARADASSSLRTAQKIARTPRIFKNISKFKAIVLRIKHDGTQPGNGIGDKAAAPAPASWADRIFSKESPTKLGGDSSSPPGLIQIWARIPEVHAALTPPSAVNEDPIELSDQDNWLIDQHDIFIAESTDVPMCRTGDIVWVNYGNKSNFTDPIYLGPIISDRNLQKSIDSSANSSSSAFGSKCNDSPIKGSSPSGDTLPGKNAVATLSAPEFLTHSDKQKYIWWLYTHQTEWLPKIKSHWVSGGQGNGARLKAYIVFRAGQLIEQLNAKAYVPRKLSFMTSLPSHEKYGGNKSTHTGWLQTDIPEWQTLAQVVWGVLYRECRHNPVGIMGGHPETAFKHNNDTGYGMHQAIIPRFEREKHQNSEDSKYGAENTGILDGVEHWNMLDPKKGLDFVLAAYLRLFRKYGKPGQYFTKKHKSFKSLMDHSTGKNHFMLGVWWAGNKEFKYQRKYNDIRVHGGKILDGATYSADYLEMANNILGSGDSFEAALVNAPNPTPPPGGGNDSEGKAISGVTAHEIWKQTFTGTVAPKTVDPDEKVKSKGGAKSQLPSSAAPETPKKCEDLSSASKHHTPGSRGLPTKSTVKEFKILAGVESPFKKGLEFKFRPKIGPRKPGVDQIVLHEPVQLHGTDAGVVKNLLKNGWGVHFAISRAGGITQHGAVEKILSHALGHNDRSIGIELYGPMYGEWAKDHADKSPTLDLQWIRNWDGGKGGSGYVTNTGPQMAALYKVIKWIFKKIPTIPQKVPGQTKSGQYHLMSPSGRRFSPLGGVIPHHWGCCKPHGDGWFAACYMFHRLNLGMGHASAYKKTQNLVNSTASLKHKPRWILLA